MMGSPEVRQCGPGEFEDELMDLLFSANIGSRYYEISKKYPIRSRIPKYTLTEVIELAKGTIALSKVKGLGTILGIDDVPNRTEILLILQHSSVAETEISFTFRGREITTTFAILCNRVTVHAGLAEHKRDHKITESERMAINLLLERYAVEDRIEQYFETGEGPNWESFTVYGLTEEDAADGTIFWGSTRLPDSSEEDFEAGVRHGCDLLTQIRRSLEGAAWRDSIDDIPIDCDTRHEAFVHPV